MLANLPIMLFPYAHKFYPIMLSFLSIMPTLCSSITVLSPTERKSMHYVQIYLHQKFNVPHHRGMQITNSHRYISSSLHGKLSKLQKLLLLLFVEVAER